MMTNRFAVRLASLAMALVASTATADQLAWNKRGVSERGAGAIKPDSLLVSYCSLADDEHVEVWRVGKVAVKATSTRGLYEVRVEGTRLFRSARSFDEGRYREPVEYKVILPGDESAGLATGIDLAYVYVPTGETTFRCLGRLLDIPCDAKVETITLPADIIARALKPEPAHMPAAASPNVPHSKLRVENLPIRDNKGRSLVLVVEDWPGADAAMQRLRVLRAGDSLRWDESAALLDLFFSDWARPIPDWRLNKDGSLFVPALPASARTDPENAEASRAQPARMYVWHEDRFEEKQP